MIQQLIQHWNQHLIQLMTQHVIQQRHRRMIRLKFPLGIRQKYQQLVCDLYRRNRVHLNFICTRTDPTHPTQCFIGSECSKTMECCPDHIDPRDEGITCACKSELSTKIKFCCLKHGASGCVDNDDCCGGKHTCFEGVCLNRKTHHQVNPKPHKRLLLQELDDV
eukprot:902967_1